MRSKNVHREQGGLGVGAEHGEDRMGEVAWVDHVRWEAMLRALAFALS